MKLAVIGNGIIGSIASSYLSRKGYYVDCIGPDLEDLNSDKFDNIKNKNSFSDNISPKFKRSDLLSCKVKSDKFFPKKTNNFFSLELGCEMGLAKYWGANLAYNGLKNDINLLELDNSEKLFLDEYLPKLNVQNFYKNKFNNELEQKEVSQYLKGLIDKEDEIKSSVLSIWEDKCEIDNLPNIEFSKAVFGAVPMKNINYKRILGKVLKIEINPKEAAFNEKIKLYLEINNYEYTYSYDYVFMACGAIGSYRLFKQSFEDANCMDQIFHHPILTSLTFIPKIPYPKKHIGMCNLDLKCNLNDESAFINFFPSISLAKSLLKSKSFVNNFKIVKYLLIMVYKTLIKTSNIPFSPGWIIRRTYFSAIYLPYKYSNANIKFSNNYIEISSKKNSKDYKKIINKLWKRIIKYNSKRGIYNLLLKPIFSPNGADLHYSSTLKEYTDSNGCVNLDGKLTKLRIIDSSSSDYLPIANPTLYFISRAIRLLREF